MLAMMLLPVLLMAAYATVSVCGMYSGMSPDRTAIFIYTFGWLTPTLMTSTAVGMFLAELTDTPVAILVQGLWWFLGLFDGIRQIDGGYGRLALSPRHNVLGNTEVFSKYLQPLVANRIFYVVLSVLLVVLTILTYQLKRSGKLDVFGHIRKIPGNCKSKHKT
jgi:hypothetical protein